MGTHYQYKRVANCGVVISGNGTLSLRGVWLNYYSLRNVEDSLSDLLSSEVTQLGADEQHNFNDEDIRTLQNLGNGN